VVLPAGAMVAFGANCNIKPNPSAAPAAAVTNVPIVFFIGPIFLVQCWYNATTAKLVMPKSEKMGAIGPFLRGKCDQFPKSSAARWVWLKNLNGEIRD
jgi:hypothetical protein